ncbi:vWA domain-containing protein [Paenibacillus senegalensis]|uniref:vWA domain-containing protein n=1 Tax=Paenibacillus senegalensis TaxID=1465766 RepID=UPI0002885DA1|nr:VWA domain-containing protein [Paenibacillus senegalensis]
MFFGSLASLWFALSLPAIIVMYLFKRKYIDTPVSSHLLWNKVLREMEANRPWQKLKNRLLMLLQLLAAALIVLALMSPYVWSNDRAQDHVVFVLDNSASMQTRLADHELTRFEYAKRSLLDWADKEARNSRYTLISLGNSPEVWLSAAASKDSLAAALAELQPYYGKAAYDEGMSLASALTRGSDDAEIRLYTDGQWLDSGSGLAFDVPVTVETIGAGEQDNLQVVQFGVGRTQADRSLVTGVAAIKNWSGQAAGYSLIVSADGEIVQHSREQLESGEQRTFYFDSLPEAEVYQLTIDADDLLELDNAAYAFLDSGHTMRAVLISDGNLFLEKALTLAGVEVYKAQQAEDTFTLPSSPFDLIVVDGVDEAKLTGEEWQRHLTSKPVWYIHAGIQGEEIVLEGSHTNRIEVAEHPVTRYIGFQDTYIASAISGSTPQWGEPVVTWGSVPLVLAGEANGHGRLMFTFALQQTDLPLRFDFPILVRNAVEWLGSTRAQILGHHLASDRREIPLHAQTSSAYWQLVENLQPAGDPIPADETANGAVTSNQTIPDRPGLYQFVEEDDAGQVLQSRWLISHADAREFNLGELPAPAFVQTDAGQPEQTDGGAAEAANSKVPISLVSFVIVLALVIMVWEWRVYQHGNSI